MTCLKTLLVLLLACVFSQQSTAQAYIPFPDSNCVWSVGTLKFKVQGDSTVNALSYKKHYVAHAYDSLFSVSWRFTGLLRQNVAQKRIYGIRESESTERLMYDFSVPVGGTVTVYSIFLGMHLLSTSNPLFPQSTWPYTLDVLMKDSVLINGQHRVRMRLGCGSGGWYTEDWIEGIGSVFGPLQPGWLHTFCETIDQSTPCVPALLCQHTNSVATYINPLFNACQGENAFVYPCNPTRLSEKGAVFETLTLFPNPTQGLFSIRSESSSEELLELSVMNALGARVYQNNAIRHNQTLDLRFLPAGIYYATLQSKAGLKTMKLVKE